MQRNTAPEMEDSAAGTGVEPHPLAGRGSGDMGGSNGLEDDMSPPTLMGLKSPTQILDRDTIWHTNAEKRKTRQLDNQLSWRETNWRREVEDLRKMYGKGWTPDRGSGQYAIERKKHKRPSLVATGKNAGDSRVRYSGAHLLTWHMWNKDFFTTVIHQRMLYLCLGACAIYITTFFFFTIFWVWIWKTDSTCLYGIQGYAAIFTLSIVTQQTIGYGNSGPQNCWKAAWLILAQSLVGVILDAIVIGVIFARISHPSQRARSIFISDRSVIARRDGILKFMFRVADIKKTQVVEPKVSAYLYTWGEGRVTAEGEFIPCRTEQLDLGYIDGMLLLPITIEHTIDERSPLCGHTLDTMLAVDAELVVTFEGTTEFGNPFMARQSYLPNEVWWGYQMANIVHRPKPNTDVYCIDTARFHEVEPQEDLPMLPQAALSRLVVSRAKRTVPYPLLGENTLVLTDSLVVEREADGLYLKMRVGDTYPNQVMQPEVRAYIYRWPPDDNPTADYTIDVLECGYETGADRLVLWLPTTVKHKIDDDASPLKHWATHDGFLQDADACIAFKVEGYLYCNTQMVMRMRVYNVYSDIKYRRRFTPMVRRPQPGSPDMKPHVNWLAFHETMPDDASEVPEYMLKLVRRSETPFSGPSEGLARMRLNGLDQDAALATALSNIGEMDTMETSSLFHGIPNLDPGSTFRRRESATLHRQLSEISFDPDATFPPRRSSIGGSGGRRERLKNALSMPVRSNFARKPLPHMPSMIAELQERRSSSVTQQNADDPEAPAHLDV